MIAADPYPWPYDGPVDPKRLALVIAGAQQAWVRRSVGAADAAAVLLAVAGVVRRAGGLVVHIRHGATAAGAGGLPPARTDPEWSLVTAREEGDLLVDAGGIDGFFASPLDHELRQRGVDTLILAGYGAEAAVNSTLRSANDRGYECLTLTDGSAPFDAETGAHTLSSITMSGGIFGAVASSHDLLAALSFLLVLAPAEATS